MHFMYFFMKIYNESFSRMSSKCEQNFLTIKKEIIKTLFIFCYFFGKHFLLKLFNSYLISTINYTHILAKRLFLSCQIQAAYIFKQTSQTKVLTLRAWCVASCDKPHPWKWVIVKIIRFPSSSLFIWRVNVIRLPYNACMIDN